MLSPRPRGQAKCIRRLRQKGAWAARLPELVLNARKPFRETEYRRPIITPPIHELTGRSREPTGFSILWGGELTECVLIRHRDDHAPDVPEIPSGSPPES